MTRSNEIEDNLPELRPVALALLVPIESNAILDRHSSWNRLIRITSWLLRFKYNTQCSSSGDKQKMVGGLSVIELNNAKTIWLKFVQATAFKTEFADLRTGKQVRASSSLKYLCPFICEAGLLRVKGRLDHASISNEQRYPIILPSSSKITRLIFEYEHIRHLHIGPQGLLANIQIRFWPLRGRNIARSVVRKCMTCFKNNPSFTTQFMAPLPRSRVSIDRPFNRTGIDFCGPIHIRSGIRRVVSVKGYIAVFVCFITRAVHLELVSSFSSDAFLAALKRFITRRGHCNHIHSDNGSNFIGANKELCTYFAADKGKTTVPDSMANLGIQWHFNPPSSLHFGGIWESAVREAKRHLAKITKNALFNFEEMSTFLCQVEAVLNSRPLVSLSDDPGDYSALTPAHFLVGGSLMLPPEPDISTVATNRLKRWKLLTAQTQIFWKRWSREYLPQLQRRNKWIKPSRNIKSGDLAILRDEVLPLAKWTLVRVSKTHPGIDGVVKVVTVRTASGSEYKRPVIKLTLLPSNEDEIDAAQDSLQ